MKKIRGQVVYTPAERIERLSEIDSQTGCWNWTGTTRNGYGKLMVGSRSDNSRRSVSAHRFSFECFHGDIPDGLEVCHKCDNPRCVNPAHLFSGTRQENVDDRVNKGRCNHAKGELNWNAKLTSTDVISARRLRSSGSTYQSIAERFSVDKTTIIHAINGKNWAHLPHTTGEQGMKLVDKVTVLPVITTLDIPTERILNAAISAELQNCFVVGVDKDGELYFASSMADGGSVLWWMEKAKVALLDI